MKRNLPSSYPEKILKFCSQYKKLIIISFLAFVLRLFIALLAEHGDVINYMWWAKDLNTNGIKGFYERSIANAMPPTYPPVTSYLFWLTAKLHNVLWQAFWFLNLHIKFFPSNMIFWLESDRGWYFVDKIPSIITDVGITITLFAFIKRFSIKAAYSSAIFFAFNPVFWYSSSLWGQTDSIFGLFMLVSFFLLAAKKAPESSLFYTAAILTKPTVIYTLPLYGYWLIRTLKKRQIVNTILLNFLLIFIMYYPFHPDKTIVWTINFFYKSLRGELGYLVANAFSIWALIWGFDNRPDTTPIAGVPSNIIAYTFYVIFMIFMWIKYRKVPLSLLSLFLSISVISFIGFLLLPRMHERYFYPVILGLTPLIALDKRIRHLAYLITLIHLINLYHFWWVPRIDFLIVLFSSFYIEKILIIINILLFLLLLSVSRFYWKPQRVIKESG